MADKSTLKLCRQSLFMHFMHISLLIFVTSLVFSNTLENTYHLDSVYRIQQNTEINKFWPPARFFTDVRTGSTISEIAEYRPMMPLSHAINSEIANATGTSKLAGFHVGNIVIHIGSAILAYFLFGLLISHWRGSPELELPAVDYSQQAFAAALIFAVHPISGSAVNYLAARDLLLMVFFFAASMLVYVAMRRKGDTVAGWLISLLLLSLAILSKQVAIMGFGLIFLFEWILADVKLKDWRLWARTALFGLPTAAYFLLRALWIVEQNSGHLRTVKGFTYPFTMLDVHFFYYLRNFVWPFEMRAMANVEMVESILEARALVGLIFIIATLVGAWLLRRRSPLISFAILAYWLLFSLTSSIFPFGYVVTDYRQYLPLIFLCLTISQACFSLRQRALPIILLTSMTLYFSFSSFHINRHWKTEESFWGQSVKYDAVALAHYNYGLNVVGKNPELAEHHYLEAIRQYPFHIYANIGLGMLYIRQEKVEEGLQRLRYMVELNPDWALSHYWLSKGFKAAGRKEEALEAVVRAAELDPRSLLYQYDAARALQDAGKLPEAIMYFERVINLNPDYESTEFWLAYAYQKSGQSQNAIDRYKDFLNHNPGHFQGHFNLAFELKARNDCKTAVEHFNKVLELRPNYREAHLHLSKCYQSLGDEPLAKQHTSMYQQKNQYQ